MGECVGSWGTTSKGLLRALTPREPMGGYVPVDSLAGPYIESVSGRVKQYYK